MCENKITNEIKKLKSVINLYICVCVCILDKYAISNKKNKKISLFIS